MKPEDLAEGVRAILSRSPSFPGRKLVVDIIANPNAGGFKRRRFAGKRKNELSQVVEQAQALPLRAEEVQVHLHHTERCGHAAAIAQRVVERSSANGRDSLHIIMTAGGDGTSLETAERLIRLPEGDKDRFGLLRLPMGTGNDGSEGRDLVTALRRFLGPLALERRSAIQVRSAEDGGKAPLWSFNIASVGLDAYVATLFYDRAYKLVPLGLKAWDGLGRLVHESETLRLLVAFGASGNRQYGSNKRILPDDRSGITVSQMGLLKKLLVKGSIEKGFHENVSEVLHFEAEKIEVQYTERLPLQCDGEVEELARCDFPLVMERLHGLYNSIVPV